MSETARLIIAVDSRQVSQGEADLARLGRTSSAVERELKALSAVASRLAAPLSAAFGAKAIYDSAEAYSTLTNRLRLVTDGAVALAAAQQAVFSISQNSRQPLEATAELYQRIATNQTALKLSGQGVADIVSTISKTLAISGASAEASKAALIQLGQAFASGTLRGEELNSVLEQAPALSQAIAAGMGKTVGELRDLGASGKLTAEAVVKALQAQAGAVDALFGKMAATVGGGLTTLGNSFTQYVGQIDQATGASGKLANEILSVSKAIDGSLPVTLATLKDNASALTQALETGLYVAAGRVAGGLLQQAGAAGVASLANRALLKSEADSARQALLNAQAKQLESKSLVERAALEIKAAEGRVASDRALQASQIASLKSVQASLSAELALEQQRLKAQMNDQGRAASIARMAEVRLAEIAIIKQIEVAERTLAATTVATSAQVEAAYAGRTAAVLAFGETTATVNALAAASTKATAAASLTGRALTGLRAAGASLLGLMGGPVGLIAIAGFAALSFVDWSSKSKTLMGDLGDLGKSVDQVRAEFNRLSEDQQRAQVNTWKDKQLGATLAVEEAYKELKNSIHSALVEVPSPDTVDLAKVAEQARAYDAVIAKLDEAKASGRALGPILREAAASGQISPAQLKSWESQAGVVGDNIAVVNQINDRLNAQTEILDQNTSATQNNNSAKAGFTTAGEKYLGTLQKQLGKLQDNNDAVKEASRYIAEHTDLSEIDRNAILSAAYAIKAQADANAASKKETRDAANETKKHATEVESLAKKLEEFLAESAISTKSSNAMADAYLAGADSVRELAIQQKIEEELLKTGAGAHKEVEAAIRGQADAEDRLAAAKSAYDLGKETEDILAQATATLQGTAALEAYNVQKAMQVALAGKNVAVGSQEYEHLLAATKAQQEAVKIAKQASDAGGIMDRLYPEKKLLREYTEAQAALNQAMQLAPDKAAEYQDALRLLGLEYEQNKNAATAWGKFTEGAVDRVDEAFAGAWKNIGDGFGSFATSLKDGFKQLLAELAHMAITRPIVMQIGAALGVGGLSAQSGGLFGGGGGSGGLGLFDMASKAYGVATSGFGSAVSAGWSAGEGFLGGMQSAISGGYNYLSSAVSGLFSGGAAATGVSNVGFGLGQSLVSGGVGSSGAATGSSASYASGSGGATALGGALAGIGGALYGYGQAGLKGAATGAAGGVGGYYAGSAIGSLVGPLGTAIGGVIGSTLGSFLGGSLFGGSWQTKDVGLSLAVEDGDFAGRQYEYQKKKGGLFGKNKKRTRYSALDPEMQAALDATYAATEGSVLDLFDRLNVELNDGVLDGLNIGAQKISTKDKTAEEIQAEIAKWFGGVADSMVSAVDAATAAGLGGYNFEGLTAFVQNLEGVNDVIRYLNKDMFETSVAGGKLAEQLTAIAGGFDVLKANGATYYGAFIGESERMDDTLDAVTRAFVAANQTLPETRTGFRDMVESIDTTTQAGMGMFATLMALSGQAATYYDILEQRANAAAQSANDSVNAAFAAIQRAVAAQQKAISKSLADANSRISDLTGISNALDAALKKLRGTGDDAVRMLRSQAQATLQSALAIAKAGGSLSGFAGLTDALDVLGSNNTDLYGSLEEFNRDQGRTANAIAELNKLNGKQLSAAEKSALAMQAQLDALDAQLEFAHAQLDALNGIDNSVKSVADAVKEMNAAVVAALQWQAAGAGKANTPGNNATLVETLYNTVLGRGSEAAGASYWGGKLQSGEVTYQQAAQQIAKEALALDSSKYSGSVSQAQIAASKAAAQKYLDSIKVPAYASGGLITGPGTGTSDSIIARLSNGEYVMSADAVRMFGTGLLDQMNAGRLPAFAQGGPVLDIPSPNQVFGSSRADVISGGSDNRALLAKFEQLLEANKSQRFQIAKYAQQVAQLLQKWDVEGAPKERDYA